MRVVDRGPLSRRAAAAGAGLAAWLLACALLGCGPGQATLAPAVAATGSPAAGPAAEVTETFPPTPVPPDLTAVLPEGSPTVQPGATISALPTATLQAPVQTGPAAAAGPTPTPLPTAEVEVTPTQRATAVPAPPPTAMAPGPRWEARSLLVGPGTPGRLYLLLADVALAAWPAERAALLVSDDEGRTWALFDGGLPPQGCVRNVNMDYATADALYASTCHGLYRWADGRWQQLTTQETGMVAVEYGQPQILWAAGTFASGEAVLRSEDGGRTWQPAASGLVHFNGVANLGIDPGDGNTLFAIIWPKYGGSYLRRGMGAGQWQTMRTPLNNAQIGTGMTIDGASGALYVTVWDGQQEHIQLWRTQNPKAPDLEAVHWELVHDFGPNAGVELLASGHGPEGLVLYATIEARTPGDDEFLGAGPGVVHRSPDGGHTWTPLPVPPPG
jgi:hypothetical protein